MEVRNGVAFVAVAPIVLRGLDAQEPGLRYAVRAGPPRGRWVAAWTPMAWMNSARGDGDPRFGSL